LTVGVERAPALTVAFGRKLVVVRGGAIHPPFDTIAQAGITLSSVVSVQCVESIGMRYAAL
jgi:hypothetical protein